MSDDKKSDDFQMKVKEPETQGKPDSSNRSGRPRRSAVGGKQDILTVNGNRDPNYEYRFVNKTGSRIEEMEGYGYKIVEDRDVSIGTKNDKHTGSSHEVTVDRKSGDKAILMRQPKKFHEEDRVSRAEAIAEGEKDMLRDLDDSSKGKYASMTITRDGT